MCPMRNRYRILLAVWALLLLGLIAWPVLRRREPVYQGKQVSVWLVQYAQNIGFLPGLPGPENPQLEKEAETAIGHIGTNAVPIYLRMIRSGESPLARVLMGHVPCVWLYRLGLGPRNSGLLGAMGLGLLGGGRKACRSSSNCAAAR